VNAIKTTKVKAVATTQYGYNDLATRWEIIPWHLPAVGMPFWWKRETPKRFTSSKKNRGEDRPNKAWMADDLAEMGRSTILSLAKKARDGDANAAQLLASLARMATIYLTNVCKTNPKLVRPLARCVREWPVVKKKNTPQSDDEFFLFGAIQLGEPDFIHFKSRTQWSLDAAGKIAYSLLWYIQNARDSSVADSKRLYGKFGAAAKRLKGDFSDDKKDDWWNLAKEIFLSSYPDPGAIKELNQLVVAKSNRKQSRLQPAILDILKRRFKAFGRKTGNRTTANKTKSHKCDCGKPATDQIGDLWVCTGCKIVLS